MEVVSPASTMGDTLSPPLPFHWLEARRGSQCGWWKSAWMVEVSMDGGSQHGWCSPTAVEQQEKPETRFCVAAPPVLECSCQTI